MGKEVDIRNWLFRHVWILHHYDTLTCFKKVKTMESILGNALLWHHNGREGVSNHRCLDGLLKRLFKHRSKKTSKLRVTGLCEGNSPVIGEFPSQKFPFDDVIMVFLFLYVGGGTYVYTNIAMACITSYVYIMFCM